MVILVYRNSLLIHAESPQAMAVPSGFYRLLLLLHLLQFALLLPIRCFINSNGRTPPCRGLQHTQWMGSPHWSFRAAKHIKELQPSFLLQWHLHGRKSPGLFLHASSTKGEESGDAPGGRATGVAATLATAARDKPLSLLERVQVNQDAAAAEQLLRRWEQQRDALLLTSWHDWAAAVGVSVQQLQQVVLLVHSRSTASAAAKHQSNGRKSAASAAPLVSASPVAASGAGGGGRIAGPVSCPGGVMSAVAYDLLLQLLHAEAALLLRGPQSPRLLQLRRPPSVQEWAAAAAADTEAADAVTAAAAALENAPDAGVAVAATTEMEAAAEAEVSLHGRDDLTTTERQQRSALHQQLGALHSLMTWQQHHLTATAAAAVRRFRGLAAARQEQRLAAAEGADAPAATSAATGATGAQTGEDLLLVALQHARECLRKHAFDAIESQQLAAPAAPSSGAQLPVHPDGSNSNMRSSIKGSNKTAAPSWVAYWGWLQQGMARWSRLQRVPYDIPLSWWTTAAALRRLRHQQETEELQLQHQQDFGTKGLQREEEKTQHQCSSLSISPQRLRAVQMATKKPISTEAELLGRTPDKGERRDRVGELLVADESTREQEQQQVMLNAAAEEIWRFAASNLGPEELQALQQAASGPLPHDLHKKEPILQSALQRLRDAEIKRLLQQLPENQRAAAAADLAVQQNLLLEQSPLLRLVRDACSH